MKKNLFFVLVSLLMFSSSRIIAGNPFVANTAMNFGADKVVHYDPDLNDQSSAIAVAFNGWIYVAYSTSHSGPPGTDIDFMISRDSGNTWQNFPASIPGTHNGAAVYDLIIAGNDTNQLRIYLSYYNFGVAFPYSFGGIAVFDGLTGSTLPYGKSIGDGTYDVGEVRLASDWNYPGTGSNGYSVAAVYVTASGDSTSTDSLVSLVMSDTSSGAFIYTLLDSSSVFNLYSPSIGYGHSLSYGNGKYFISYMKGTDVMYCKDSTTVVSAFTTPLNLNSIIGIPTASVGYPKICCQNSSTDNDSSGLSVIIMTRGLDSIVSGTYNIPYILFNIDAAQADYWSAENIFSTTNNSSMRTYDVNYSEEQDRFFLTGYYEDSLQLFVRSEDFNFSNTGNWLQVSDQYNDSLIDPSIEPNPRITTFGDYAYTTWTMAALGTGGLPVSRTMFDMQSLPLLTSVSIIKEIDTQTFPNPAVSTISIKSSDRIFIADLYSISGNKVMSTHPESTEFSIDVKDFVCGVYFLRMTTGSGENISRKIVLSR
jgi:hypothetical protein